MLIDVSNITSVLQIDSPPYVLYFSEYLNIWNDTSINHTSRIRMALVALFPFDKIFPPVLCWSSWYCLENGLRVTAKSSSLFSKFLAIARDYLPIQGFCNFQKSFQFCGTSKFNILAFNVLKLEKKINLNISCCA